MARPRTGNKRGKMIEAASSLFSGQGYDRTTTAEISRKAEVAAGTLYVYFESKRELLQATYTVFQEELGQCVAYAAEGGDSPAEKLKAILEAYFRQIEVKRDIAKVFLVETPHGNSISHAPIEMAQSGLASQIHKVVLEGQELGQFKGNSASDIAEMVVGAAESLARCWLMDPKWQVARRPCQTALLCP